MLMNCPRSLGVLKVREGASSPIAYRDYLSVDEDQRLEIKDLPSST